ncbi:MAG: hypothetical protein U1C46_11690 [Bacteroidales bacterium]|nr:hypothetical protein [Bacteroidales bacterium]MDZ4205463.1 hypothetical protein [Bacteroidales bacterium]
MKKLSVGIMLLASCICFVSCSENAKVRRKIKKVDVANVEINRYDKALFDVKDIDFREGIKALQKEFRPFLNADLEDPQNISQLFDFVNDTFVQQLHRTTIDMYPELDKTEKDLTEAFRHIKYYFPDWSQPEVFTFVSGLYDEQPVQYNGSELILALDLYLGDDFKGYRQVGFPLFRIKRMQQAYLVADVMKEIASVEFIKPEPYKHLLDKMIADGKLLYLLDCFLPRVADEFKIGFSQNELKWCKNHNSEMWAYLLEHQLLYANDPIVVNKFINDGPFTAAFQNESPARASLWVGWQIVRSYMKNNPETSPQELINLSDATQMLVRSKYKPGRF